MQETLEYIKQAFDLKKQQCYKQAIEMLYKALELESDNVEILFQLGELYFLLNNFSRSIHYLEKVISINPGHIETLEILEKIYLYSKDFSSALSTAEKILTLKNNSQNIINFIDIVSLSGNLKKIKDFETSNDDNVLYHIANAYYENKYPKDAQEKLEEALKINPENEDALVLLGKIYFDKSDFEKAKNIFNTFPKTSDNPEVLNYLGLFAIEDLKFIDAIKYFSKAFNIDKKNGKYAYNLGNAYFYNGWIKEASESYLQAIRIEPENYGYRYSLAYLYFEAKMFDKAQSEVDYILENDENYHQAHVLNALLKFEKKDFLGAKSELEMTMKLSDDNFTLSALAKVYNELLIFDKAEKLIRKVLERNPKSLNYRCQLAEIYISQKKYDEAVDIINNIIKDNENYVPAYIIGAKASLENKNLENAKEFAQNAISLDMNYAGGYYYLAMVRFEEKDYEEAKECMKRAITYDVENHIYYAQMSKIYEAQEDYKTALEYIQEAETISGNNEYKLTFQRLAKICRKI